MKIYRVSARNDTARPDMPDGHLGYWFFSSKREADKAAKEKRGVRQDVRVDQISVEPTKAGILSALNHYAGHPDNG